MTEHRDEATGKHAKSPQTVVRSRSARAWAPALAVFIVAFALVGFWWRWTMAPRDVELPGPDPISGSQSETAEQSAGEVDSPATAVSDANSDFDQVRDRVERLVDEGDTRAAIDLIDQWETDRQSAPLRDKTELTLMRARALIRDGRVDEAEVHLLLASEQARGLPPQHRGDLAERIEATIAELAWPPDATSGVEPAVPSNVVEPDEAVVIRVSLSSHFTATRAMGVKGANASWYSRNHRIEEVPVFSLREPQYRGQTQRYGALQLGSSSESLFSFVFDVADGAEPVLWFDRNGNYDLTDDGPPLENRGTGIFATEIEFPLVRILPRLPVGDPFNIWFFTNDTLWPQGYASHYCRTLLSGQVSFGGMTFPAYVVDTKFNDADFRNDGILIDLNRDGIIDQSERIPDGKALVHRGKQYRFEMRW